MNDALEWYVVMYRVESLNEEYRLGPFTSEEIADAADKKLCAQMDKARFYTRIVKKRRKILFKERP